MPPISPPQKMPLIAKAIAEVKHTVTTIAFTQAYVDALVVFLLSLVTLQLMRVAWYYAIAPFTVYLALHLLTSLRFTRLAYVEEKAPILYEQLRTAADSIGKENDVVRELHNDVVRKMREVRNSYFIGFGKLTGRLFTLIIISFVSIFAAATDVHLLDFNKVVSDLQRGRGFMQYDINESLLQFNESYNDDIFGNKSLAQLGTEELNLQITPLQTDIDISQVKPPEERDFRQSSAAKDIKAVADASYGDPIPQGYSKIVRNYFRDLDTK